MQMYFKEDSMNDQYLILPLFNIKTVKELVYLGSKFYKNCVTILVAQVKSHGNAEYLLSNL